MITRLQWQQFAERWLLDAKTLLDDKRWSAAYYTSGYAVECGLKACILARLLREPEVIFADRRFSDKCWTHGLDELMKLADLESARVASIRANPAFKQNWVVVRDWDEGSRYETTPHHKAKRLYRAIVDNPNGVMPWIRAHW